MNLRTLIAVLLLAILIHPFISFNASQEITKAGISSKYLSNHDTYMNNKELTNKSIVSKNHTINETHIRALIGNLSKFISTPGGFAEKIKGEPVTNATFYGILSLAITGRLELVEKNLSTFLDYLYDNTTFMFRDWLGGKPNIVSTAFGVMIVKITNVDFSEYNETKTLEKLSDALLEYLSGNNSFNLTMPDFIILTEALYFTNKSIVLNYSNEIIANIMKFYSNGVFYDSNSRISKLQQTYMAIHLINLVNRSIDEKIREKVKQYVDSLRYQGNKTEFLGGFGEKPTALETGFAISLLRELDLLDENTSKQAEQFFARCINLSTKIQKYPGGPKADFYDLVAMLIGIYSLGIFEQYTSINILSDLQIPIDLSTAYIDVNVSIVGDDLDYAPVYYIIKNNTFSIAGNCTFSESLGYYKISFIPSKLGFGAFNLIIIVNFSYPFVPQYLLNKTKLLRIGYKMSLNVSSKSLKPGENITIQVSVSFNNGSIPKEGFLAIEIVREYTNSILNSSIFNISAVNGSVTYTWRIPNDIPLGIIKISSYVNDSRGCNHTRKETYVKLWDLLVFTLAGNKSEYAIGEQMTFNFTLAYESTNVSVPFNEVMKLEVRVMAAHTVWFNVSYYPINGSSVGDGNITIANNTVHVNTRVPNCLPPYGYTRVLVYVKFDPNVTVTTKAAYLFKFNVTITDLKLTNIIIGKTFIGNTLNVSFNIISNVTNASLINATLLVKLIKDNTTKQVFKYFWNTSNYITNETVDPNIPVGNYTLEFWLNTTSYLHKFVKINTTENITVEILGVPVVSNYTITPKKPLEYSAIVITFNITCNETNKTLAGLILSANISYNDHVITTLIRETENHTYILHFYARRSSTYDITLFRESDNYTILQIKISIGERPSIILGFLEKYGAGIWLAIYISTFIVLWIVRKKFTRKVSRLWLKH